MIRLFAITASSAMKVCPRSGWTNGNREPPKLSSRELVLVHITQQHGVAALDSIYA
jgi:hypothetical protein